MLPEFKVPGHTDRVKALRRLNNDISARLLEYWQASSISSFEESKGYGCTT